MGSGLPESLVPQLREAEGALRHALADACSTRPPTRASTGELVLCEGALERASKAAKMAITIRRRRRLDEVQRTERVVMADAEAAARPATTHRTFVDSHGVTWDVFAVYPVARTAPHAQLVGSFQQGWLCFESVAEKRRLSPIPPKWELQTNQGLEELSRRAIVAPARRRRPGPESERGDTHTSDR